MTDPITAAVQRAYRVWRFHPNEPMAVDAAKLGALEVLKPIRELHKPVPISAFSTARMSGSRAECAACNRGWPCVTARLIYTSEELS